jgi:DNA-binding MltR family transcriptional regulator
MVEKFNKDAGHAILTAARLDSLLYRLLRHAMSTMSNGLAETLFDTRGPLATLSAKIDLARGMDLIDAATQRDLHRIRKLRNIFAHIDRPVHFTSPDVVDEAKKLFARNWTEGASIRRLLDDAATRCEAAMNGKISSLVYKQVTTILKTPHHACPALFAVASMPGVSTSPT